jgi:Flp pilus assembly protein TadG
MLRAKRPWLRQLIRENSGNVLAITAACLPLLIGAAGLAVDTAEWSYWKRQLQREADSAALAGAFAIAQGKDAVAAATNDLNRTNSLTLSGSPDISSAPNAGAYAGNPQAVRVSITTAQRLPFSGYFMSSPPSFTAHATAAVVTNGTYCAIALGSTTSAGITMQGNATLSFGCGLATNSRATNAVIAGGSSSITATPVAAVGGLTTSSNYSGTTQLLPYSPPQPDPYAGLANPSPSGCQNQVTVGPNSTQALSPGCYKGINIKGTATLSPGTYYIDGSSFSVGSQANVSVTGSDGVTIVLTSSTAASNPSSIATLDMNAGATVQLTASTSGTYSGILFYQDRRALDSGANTINGNANSTFQGAFYFPSQELDFSGTSGMTTNCLQLVALRLTFTGNTSISNNCPAGGGSHAFIGAQVRLVE